MPVKAATPSLRIPPSRSLVLAINHMAPAEDARPIGGSTSRQTSPFCRKVDEQRCNHPLRRLRAMYRAQFLVGAEEYPVDSPFCTDS